VTGEISETRRKQLVDLFVTRELSWRLPHLEDQLVGTSTTKIPPEFALGRFTLVDALLFSALEAIEKEIPGVASCAPRLCLWRSSFGERPRVSQLTDSGERF
jgi:hypothetical protein